MFRYFWGIFLRTSLINSYVCSTKITFLVCIYLLYYFATKLLKGMVVFCIAMNFLVYIYLIIMCLVVYV